MWDGKPALLKFIEDNDKPEFKVWLQNNKSVFDSHDSDSTKHLRSLWIKRFLRLLEKEKGTLHSSVLKDLSNVPSTLWEELFNRGKKLVIIPVQLTNKNALYQWGYILMGDTSLTLEKFLQEAAATIETIKNSNSTEPVSVLNKMSLTLLEEYSTGSSDEKATKKNVLKLCLSNIINMISPIMRTIFQRNFDANQWSRWLAPVVINLPDNLLANINGTCDHCFNKIKNANTTERVLYFCEQKKAAAERGDMIKLDLLNVFEIIVLLIPSWKKQNEKGESESEFVSRVELILNLLFTRSTLTVKIGETASPESKRVRLKNEERFGYSFFSGSSSPAAAASSTAESPSTAASPSTATSASTLSHYEHTPKNILGRKIDLKLIGDKHELVCSEFKARNVSLMMERQQSKSLRLNKINVEKFERMEVYQEGDNLRVMGLAWGGAQGYMYTMEKLDSAYVGKKFENVVIPDDIRLFNNSFKKTIIAFYQWKQFMEDLNDKLFEADQNINLNNINSGIISPSVFMSPNNI